MLNHVVLVGRLVEDPVVEKASNDKSYTLITLAVQRNYKNIDGIYETDFIRCVLWNGIAANTSKYCHKGDIVGVKGRIQNWSYENSEQEKRYTNDVIAERVTFLSNAIEKTSKVDNAK